MDLPNPVIRSHYGNGFVKQYVRDHLMLRTETASNNVNDYGVNKSVENLPVLRNALSAINDNYLNIQQDILETFIDRGQLRQLAEPTITPTGKRIPGLKLDHPRQLALMHALVAKAIATRSPLSARCENGWYNMFLCGPSVSKPHDNSVKSNENKIPTTATITV